MSETAPITVVGRYRLSTEIEFAAAHQLHGYEGNCARLHGHNWKIVVEVTGNRLDKVGMVLDFREIKKQARAVAKRLDHRYLNELAPFDQQNPTAECIAAYFYQQLSQHFDCDDYHISAVTTWENDRSAVRFEPIG
ncbi:MAG TPA: 6-carboxytetrahydropterin synthase QueD [Halothiobacillaceae bacterium]|nr:6-carboxytetrahydropterin synthase QueD [Halothiobacillaceae bacterium]